jgi:hypothetical protein
MTETKITMAEIAVKYLKSEQPVPLEFNGQNRFDLGGSMEYITQYKDGSYLSTTPSQGGGFDFHAIAADYFTK